MDNKKFLWAGLTLLLLVSLFVAFQSAMATNPPPPDNPCGESGNQGDTTLKVSKTVYCDRERDWSWVITKSADQSSVTLSEGQQLDVNYTVIVEATATDYNFGVNGAITIYNRTVNSVLIQSVSDSLGSIQGCFFGSGQPINLPFQLPGGWTIWCDYSGNPGSAVPENVATVVYDGGTTGATAPIDWTQAIGNEIDECALISDTYPGGPNETVCADGQTSFTFPYTSTIGPYEECGEFTVPNTASFLTNDTGATGEADWNVDVTVPCEGGCTLTPGYWKTHSSYGPAPYDDTWAEIGENTIFFLSGQSYYNVLWTSPGGNAYYILAHAYIAAELNFLNGASSTPAVDAAFATATGLFQTYTPADIAAMMGNDPIRQQFIALAEILDDYNNGLIGPGHCSE